MLPTYSSPDFQTPRENAVVVSAVDELIIPATFSAKVAASVFENER